MNEYMAEASFRPDFIGAVNPADIYYIKLHSKQHVVYSGHWH